MTQNFGYNPNPEASAAMADAQPRCYGEQIESLVRDDDGGDVFAYRALVWLLKQIPALANRWLLFLDGSLRLRSRNQGPYGTCVGMGTATALDLMQAWNIAEQGQAESLPALHSAVGAYGLARHASNDLGRHDGSYGSATIKAMLNWGLLYQMKYGAYDLSDYNGDTARLWAYRGVPAAMAVEANQHRLTAYQRVKSGEEVWALAGIGRPTIMCSQVGWNGSRDSDGAIRRNGRWAHCMCAGAARRTTSSGRRLILVMQSYGDNGIKGPYFSDQPLGSFYADIDDIDAAVRQGDSWAVADVNGFEAKGASPWA